MKGVAMKRRFASILPGPAGLMRVLFLAAVLMAAMSPAAQEAARPDTAAILKQLDTLNDFGSSDFSAMFTIVSEKPGEKQSMTQVRIFRRDSKSQSTLLIMLPEIDKGQGYLMDGDNVWFYDPTSRKFSHSSLKENLQSTEAKNSDFRASSLSKDYSVESVTEGMVGKYPVWILDLKALRKEVSYERVKLYVTKDSSMTLKREDYSVSGRLMRSTFFTKYAKIGGKLLPSQVLVVDEINKGEKSQISMTEQSMDKLPDKVFTKAFLEQVNR